MNHKQLKSFLCVAEQKSFSKAAEISYVSTQAIISQISILEKNLGINLFKRSSRGVELTQEGLLFVDTAQNLLSVYEGAKDRCRRLKEENKILVSLHSLYKGNVCQFLVKYMIDHPDHKVQILTLEDYEALDALNSEDVGVLFGPEFLNVNAEIDEFIKVSEHRFSIIMRKDHPLASKSLITIEDLIPFKVYASVCPALVSNPAKILIEHGIDVIRLDNRFNFDLFINTLLDNSLFLEVGNPNYASFPYTTCVPTELTAGKYGFMIRKDSDELIRSFVNEYFDWNKDLQNLS